MVFAVDVVIVGDELVAGLGVQPALLRPLLDFFDPPFCLEANSLS